MDELCTLLVEDLYGSLGAKVFSALARHGRLPFRTLLEHTDLEKRSLQYGLVALAQQHLIRHYTTLGVTFYEADLDHAYSILRFGKALKYVEDRFGEKAASVISNLIELGHAKVQDLANAYGFSQEQAKVKTEVYRVNGAGLTNGLDSANKQDGEITTLGQLHSVLDQLLQAGWITSVSIRAYYTKADLHTEAEKMVAREYGKSKIDLVGKKKQEFAADVIQLKRKWRDEPEEEQTSSGIGKKRTLNPTNGRPAKRARLSMGLNGAYGGEEEEFNSRLNGDLILSINYDKIKVVMRNQQLVFLAQRHISETTAKVYEALLRQTEDQVPRIYDEYEQYANEDAEQFSWPSVTISQIMTVLDPQLDLKSGLADEDAAGAPPKGSPKEEEDFKSDSGIGVEEDPDESKVMMEASERRSLVEAHVKLLAKDPRIFSQWHKGQEYKVNFRRLTGILIQNEIEKTIQARFSKLPLRIVRILHALGAMDQRQIATLAMCGVKTVQAPLGALKEAGFILNHDMPKGARYAPGTIIHLFSFDQDYTRQAILADTYKTMARLIQRARVEKEKVQMVIDKAERTDVAGNEDKYLSKGEKMALREFKNKEEKLLAQLARCDDLVAVLRDFPMPALDEDAA